MYRQHTPIQRILFWDQDGNLNDYELKTVIFGINCAPFLAFRVLQQLSMDVQRTHIR